MQTIGNKISIHHRIIRWLDCFIGDTQPLSVVYVGKRGGFSPEQVFRVHYIWEYYAQNPIPESNETAFDRWNRNLTVKQWESNGYRQYGLLFDDMLNDEIPVVAEAVNRLPKALREARERRVSRAVHLQLRDEILPEDEWTTMEEDYAYLQPYVDWAEFEFSQYDEFDQMDHDMGLPSMEAKVQEFDHFEFGKKRRIDQF